jgi:hypothetical protein
MPTEPVPTVMSLVTWVSTFAAMTVVPVPFTKFDVKTEFPYF